MIGYWPCESLACGWSPFCGFYGEVFGYSQWVKTVDNSGRVPLLKAIQQTSYLIRQNLLVPFSLHPLLRQNNGHLATTDSCHIPSSCSHIMQDHPDWWSRAHDLRVLINRECLLLVYAYTIRVETKITIVHNSMEWTIITIKGGLSLSYIRTLTDVHSCK